MKALLYLLFCLMSVGSFAQEDVTVRLLNLPKSVKIGDRFTLIAEISCPKPMSNRVWMDVRLPASWQVITKKVPPRIVGLKSARFNYTVSIGRQTMAGQQAVKVVIFKHGFESFMQLYETEIERIRKIEITSVNLPPYVKEGQKLRTEYFVYNHGNAPEQLSLYTTRGIIEDYQVPIVLNVHESKRVFVVQQIPITDGTAWTASADLKAMPADSTQPIYKVVTVPVFTNKIKENDPYMRFPIEVGVWYNAIRGLGRSLDGVQFDVRGQGYVDLNKKHYIDFIAHGPNQMNLPIMGAFDQYSFNYSNARHSVSLGDYALAYSKLIELNRFGRGIRYQFQGEKRGFSLLYQKPRFFPNITEIVGGQYHFKNQRDYDFSANYMSKQILNNNQQFWVHLVGGSSFIKTKKWDIETELATNYAHQKVDMGLFSNVVYNGERFRGSNNLVYAGKEFYGFYNNGWLLNNALYYNLTSRLTAALINNYNRVNPSLDLLVLNTSPYYKNHTAELTYRITRLSRLVLNATHQYKEDRQQVKKFHFKEDYLRLMYFYQTDSYNLWLDGQHGYTHNLLVSPDKSQRRFSSRVLFQNEFKVTPMLSMGGNAEYLKTSKYSLTNEPATYFFYGGTLKCRIHKTFDFNLTYRNNFAPDELVERRNFFDLSTNLRLGQHQLSLIGTQSYIPGFEELNNKIVSLRYRYLFNLPVAKYKHLGSLKGQLISPEGTPTGGVLVQVGSNRYLTDTKGNFIFNNLKPDKYTLNLARSSMAMGIVPTIQVPMEISLKADSTVNVIIPLSKSGNIIGKIIYEKNTQIGPQEQTPSPVAILLKLHNEKTSMLTMADQFGDFSFKEVLPGEWTLTATLLDKNEKVTILQPKKLLRVSADQSAQVSFTVKPIIRNVRFTDKTILISSK